ncbi:MAG: hypothetical protein ACRYHQ_37125, partial [Janthinobacterium lividum]
MGKQVEALEDEAELPPPPGHLAAVRGAGNVRLVQPDGSGVGLLQPVQAAQQRPPARADGPMIATVSPSAT